MQNKKGLIMGVANDRSIAWGIAKKLAEQGAEVAFTYQGEALKKRVEPLAKEIGSSILRLSPESTCISTTSTSLKSPRSGTKTFSCDEMA